MAKEFYEIKVVGAFGPATRAAFEDMTVEIEPTATVLSGAMDQDELHALLDRLSALNLELLEVRQEAQPR